MHGKLIYTTQIYTIIQQRNFDAMVLFHSNAKYRF